MISVGLPATVLGESTAALQRQVLAAVAAAVRPIVRGGRRDSLRAFRLAIPIDTGDMRRAARARASVRMGRRAGLPVIRVSVSWVFAGREQVAFNSLARHHRVDLRGWPVKHFRSRTWPRVRDAAVQAARPLIVEGVRAIALRKLWGNRLRRRTVRFQL